MRWMFFAMAAAVAAMLWPLPGEAAQPAPAPAPAPVPAAAANNADRITFEQYRDWRNDFIERRRSELAMQLSTANLPAVQKARLEQVKAYYDWLAGLPAADRDGRFRERFDQIDADHDGTIDMAERAAWRDKQRAFYHRAAGSAVSARSASDGLALPSGPH
jgi:hypothetical protein